MKHIDININSTLNLPTIDKFIYKLGYKKITQKDSIIRYSRKIPCMDIHRLWKLTENMME